MRISTIIGAAALSMAATTAANAAVIVGEAEEGNNYAIAFLGLADPNGPVVVVPELTATMDLTFVSRSADGLSYTFSYDLSNTSSIDSTITGFGLDVDASLSGASASGIFGDWAFGSNYPVGHGPVDFCVYNSGNCTGGNPNLGIADGGMGSGGFVLTLSAPADQLTLHDFVVRYQAINGAGFQGGSAIGVESPVPEPGTWLMMILGFAAIGGAMRRRKQAVQVTYA